MKKSELKSLIREMILVEEDPRQSILYKATVAKLTPVITSAASNKDITAHGVTGTIKRPQLVSTNVGTILNGLDELEQDEFIKHQLRYKKVAWRWISSHSQVDVSSFDEMKKQYDSDRDDFYVKITKQLIAIIKERAKGKALRQSSIMMAKYLAIPIVYANSGKLKYEYLMKIYYDYFVQPARDEDETRLKAQMKR